MREITIENINFTNNVIRADDEFVNVSYGIVEIDYKMYDQFNEVYGVYKMPFKEYSELTYFNLVQLVHSNFNKMLHN